jgi:EKC/KEOPS complex subunit PCC1/LAGE3
MLTVSISNPFILHSSSRFLPTSTIDLPLPTHRLASSALRALQVDTEISPLVHRSFDLVTASPQTSQTPTSSVPQSGPLLDGVASPSIESGKQRAEDESKTILQVTYKATTNRMLRVAVNAFMNTLGVVLGVMEELDVDVLEEELGRG